MSDLSLQPAVSRPLSIRAQLAQDVWQWGVSPFYTERIPFSIRSGRGYAGRLVEIYVKFLSQGSEKKGKAPLHLYEFGAGLGLLSLFFLDALKEKDPAVYQRTYLHVTDGSDIIVNQLKALPQLKRHPQLSIEVMDAASPVFKENERPFFCFSTYLLDALPAISCHYQNGVLKEWYVQTSLIPGAGILDSTEEAPKWISPTELKALLSGTNSEKRRALAPQIIASIDETFVLEDFSHASGMSEQEKQDLMTFLHHHVPNGQAVSFNYSGKIRPHIETVHAAFEGRGCYVVSDFGLANTMMEVDPSCLVASYGVSMFYSVNFPYVTHITEKKSETTVISTNRELDQTQEWVLLHQSESAALREYVETSWKEIGLENISTVIDTLSSWEKFEWETELNTVMESLSENERTDYFLLKTVCTQLYAVGLGDIAIQYAQDMVEVYGSLAIDGMIVLAWAGQQLGNHQDALGFFDSASVICPNSAMIWSGKGVSYFYLKEIEKAKICFLEALKYALPSEVSPIQNWLEKVNVPESAHTS